MMNKRSNKGIKRGILLTLVTVYAALVIWRMITIPKPIKIVVSAEPTELIADGVQRSMIHVTIYDSTGKLMSGQKISFKKVIGDGEVEAIRNVTSGDGLAIGAYTAGHARETVVAKVICENETGLSKIVEIRETPILSMIRSVDLVSDPQTIAISRMESATITATAIDQNGHPISNHKLVFKVKSGAGTFYGFRIMNQLTDENGEASVVYMPGGKAGTDVISVNSESQLGIAKTVSITVQK